MSFSCQGDSSVLLALQQMRSIKTLPVQAAKVSGKQVFPS